MGRDNHSYLKISIVPNIGKSIEFITKNTIIALSIICGVSLFLRMFYFPFNIPLTHDAVSYFWYAIDTNVLGYFPTDYKFSNTGWSMILSLFFGIFHSNNFVDYMTVQRLGTVIISVLTIIPVYFLCKKIFSRSISLVGAFLFAIEPHVIQNSLLGLTDTLYILLIIVSFVLLQSSNKKLVYLSFTVAALSSLVRYEGMLFVVVLTIIFFVRFRKEGKVILKYAFALAVYILSLLPILYVRIQGTGDDGVASSVMAGAMAPGIITAGQEHREMALLLFVVHGFENLIKYTGWVMIPYFVILVPIGVILGFKRKNPHYFGVLLSIIILAIPALYAYSRDIQETRYLLVLMPFFSVLSLFVIDSIANKTSSRKLFFILLIVSVFASSWTFLELKKVDQEHEREAFAIAQQVAKFTKVTNVYEPESKYLKIASIETDFPILRSSSPPPTITLPTNYTSLEDFIKSNKDSNLTHIVVDDNKNRPNFLKDLFSHEEKYPYLIKVYDSLDYGFKYHVKIYKIDYEKFAQNKTH